MCVLIRVGMCVLIRVGACLCTCHIVFTCRVWMHKHACMCNEYEMLHIWHMCVFSDVHAGMFEFKLVHVCKMNACVQGCTDVYTVDL